MTLLGLTGGVGMGKSACADLLRARGIPVVDTDTLARQLVEPGQPALGEIRDVFGAEFMDPAGRLRRDELGRRVFSDAAARKKLEDILHPRIRQLWHQWVEQRRREHHSLTVVAIPLLFETRAETEFDLTLCVVCSAATQHQRLSARGWSDAEIEARNRAQLPVEQKLARANYVIWAEGGLDVHAGQLDRILSKLRAVP